MWFSKTSQDVLNELDVDPRMGLNQEEAKLRLENMGKTN